MTRQFVLLALAFVLLFAADLSRADEITVTRLSGRVEGEFYFVDAEVHIDLSPDARDAIDSGVPLQFAFDFEIHRPRRFMWDKRVLGLRRAWRLERHALANKYVVTDIVTRKRVVHTSMSDAIEALGRLSDITLGKAQDLLSTPGLQGRMRAQLDIEALPAPLRPIAYLSPSWHLRSDWRAWDLAP